MSGAPVGDPSCTPLGKCMYGLNHERFCSYFGSNDCVQPALSSVLRIGRWQRFSATTAIMSMAAAKAAAEKAERNRRKRANQKANRSKEWKQSVDTEDEEDVMEDWAAHVREQLGG